MVRRQAKFMKKNIKNNEEAIIDALREDLGKSPFESYETEIGMVYQEISYMLKHLRRLSAPKRVGTPLSCFPAQSRIYPEPYGVVLIMSPWNYPFQLTMVPLIGAIAAGNCAVVKPSAYSPAVSALVKKILSEIFSESYVCVVLGGREENRELLKKLGLVVYLDVSPETVYKRIGADVSSRPMLHSDDVPGRIRSLLNERRPLYLKAAHVAVDVNDRSLDAITEEIYREAHK